MSDLIERLRDDYEGRDISDWGILREAADALAAMQSTDYQCRAHQCRRQAGEMRGEIERLRRDLADFYAAIPQLPITAETMDAATDLLTRFCIDFQPEIDAARQEGEDNG